jgi:transcriptional regulator with XRE-family HTH domain
MGHATVAGRLRVVRKKAEISARELARLSGVSEPLIGYIERSPHGDRSRVRTLVAITKVLGCSLDWLLLGVGDAPRGIAVRAAVAKARARLAMASGGAGGGAESPPPAPGGAP